MVDCLIDVSSQQSAVSQSAFVSVGLMGLQNASSPNSVKGCDKRGLRVIQDYLFLLKGFSSTSCVTK